MPSHFQPTSNARYTAKALSSLRRGPGIFVGLLLVIWVALPFLPEETGLRFGMGYQMFFTAMVLLGAVFFWFLGRGRVPSPTSTAGVLGSLSAVFLLTIGVLVLAGVVYPQFPRPLPPVAVEQEAAKRGEALFWSETGKAGCFRCHAVGGRGGTRGPDLTLVATRASGRVSGLTAEEYLSEKLKAGATYEFLVPEYAPMMPPFGQLLSEDQIEDLVSYLLSLR